MGMTEKEAAKIRIIDHYPGPWKSLPLADAWQMTIEEFNRHPMLVACIFEKRLVTFPRTFGFEADAFVGFFGQIYDRDKVMLLRTLVTAPKPEECAEKLSKIGAVYDEFCQSIEAMRESGELTDIEHM